MSDNIVAGPEALLPLGALESAKVDSLTELLSRDPLSLARDPAARAEIVRVLRARRADFVKKEQEDAAAKPRKRAVTTNAAGVKNVVATEVNFDDL